jgi:hypothetical protein
MARTGDRGISGRYRAGVMTAVTSLPYAEELGRCIRASRRS